MFLLYPYSTFQNQAFFKGWPYPNHEYHTIWFLSCLHPSWIELISSINIVKHCLPKKLHLILDSDQLVGGTRKSGFRLPAQPICSLFPPQTLLPTLPSLFPSLLSLPALCSHQICFQLPVLNSLASSSTPHTLLPQFLPNLCPHSSPCSLLQASNRLFPNPFSQSPVCTFWAGCWHKTNI